MHRIKHCPRCGSTNTAIWDSESIFCLDCHMLYQVLVQERNMEVKNVGN